MHLNAGRIPGVMCIDVARPYFVVICFSYIARRAKDLSVSGGGIDHDVVRCIAKFGAWVMLPSAGYT